jgi:hypothetical protein
MEKEEQRFLIKYLWMKNWGSTKINQELVTTLGADAYGRSQIKIWLQKSRNGDISSKDAPRTGRRPLTLSLPCGISSQVSFSQCPSTCAALPDERADDYGNSLKRVGIEKILAALGSPFSVLALKKLLLLKHRQKCYAFYRSQEKIISKES